MRPKLIVILALIIILAGVTVANYFYKPEIHVPVKAVVGWKDAFAPESVNGSTGIPEGWKLTGKPGTKKAVFSVVEDKKDGISFLHMEADKASGSIITRIEKIDLEKTPVLRWRWKVTALPKGADGRKGSTDDQAIGIYVGSGTMLSKKSISYRWDTDTPKGAEGECAYGAGTIKVKWYTLRNKEDGLNKWYVDQRNCMEDFKDAWGYYPEKIYLSVTCNSQYTGTRAAGDLNWIELESSTGAGK